MKMRNTSLSTEQRVLPMAESLITNILNDAHGESVPLVGLMRFFGLVTPVVFNFSLHKSHSQGIFKMQIPDVCPF